MNAKPVEDRFDDLASPVSLAWAFGGAAAGALVALVLLPDVAPALAASLSAPQPKLWWHLSRTSGLVSYALLTVSTLLGLLLSTKFAKSWPGASAAFSLHEHASILGLALGCFHAVVLLGDRHTPFTLAELLIPFGAAYRPAAVGLGQLTLYGTALLVSTFYVRKRIGQRVWRLIHFASFGVFAAALGHALAAGTDRLLVLVGIAPAAAALFFAVYRALVRLLSPRAARCCT
jgi:predicted ferric reductase